MDEPTAGVMTVEGLSKAFGGIYALHDVSLRFQPGEIHSIVGGNGSGKSTMIKALAGVQPADQGTLTIRGNVYDLRQFTPTLARKSGVHVVHQHRTTFNAMTVTENLSMGRGFETGPLGKIRWGAARRRAEALIERYGIRATSGTLVRDLGPASQTMLEIARALQDQDGVGDGVLMLDEPTAALPTHEVDLLLEALRGYATQGQAIVFISHRLDEVMAISDRVTALRDGAVATSFTRADLTRKAIVTAMVGEVVLPERKDAAPPREGSPVLVASGLWGGAVKDADLTLHPGEIVGIAGLAGSGRSTLLRLLFGAQDRHAGSVTLEGQPIGSGNPARAIRAGMALVPEDRANDAAFADMTIVENTTIANVGRYTAYTRVNRAKERATTVAAIKRFLVRAASPALPISALSGGNQQKIMIARWMIEDPKVLLLDEPTQGVDVGARAELWEIIERAAADGLSVLLVSSDIEELTHLSTRILVMRGGRIVQQLDGPGLTDSDVNGALHALDVAV